jgi:polyisoprenoid-binding protein YceI
MARNQKTLTVILFSLQILGMLSSSWGFVADAGEPALAPAPGVYRADPQTSRLEFSITNFWGVTTTEGHFNTFEVGLKIAEPFASSTVQGSAEVATLDTGNNKRDTHLRTADFFDESRFPKILFTSSRIVGPAQAFMLEGTLTLHGVAKTVSFNCVWREGEWLAEGTIRRQDFGLNYRSMGLADLVNLRLKIKPVAEANAKTL